MNQVLLFSMLSFLFCKPVSLRQIKKDKVFYFCDSGAWDRKDFSNKQVVQYTEIKELDNNIDSIQKITTLWAALAHKQCENVSGCTATLNYYPTYESAKLEYDKIIKSYRDTARFIVKKRDF